MLKRIPFLEAAFLQGQACLILKPKSTASEHPTPTREESEVLLPSQDPVGAPR